MNALATSPAPSSPVSFETTPQQRTAARVAAGAICYGGRADNAVPVVVVPGDQPPTLEGRSYYWTTPSGKTVVHHPNAYRWPTRYWPSTRRVVVGAEWFRG